MRGLQVAPMDTQTTAETLGSIRLAIFRQHTQLEQLSDELEAHAMAVVNGGERSLAGKALNAALELLYTHFMRHLDWRSWRSAGPYAATAPRSRCLRRPVHRAIRLSMKVRRCGSR
jgi:hypothetical protein